MKNKDTQTILGSGGTIGTELARALRTYTQSIRLVSRNPRKVNDTDTLHQADLTNPAQVQAAVEGSEICYLTIAFDYSTKVWEQRWLPLMHNVLDACNRHGAKLVFFDNVYAVGGDHIRHITEDSPIAPTSRKGAVRANVDRLVLEAVEKGRVKAIIARSPDFFGTDRETSVLMNLVYNNLEKGKAAQWFCNADVPHTNGYVPDLAKGTAMLGNTPDAFDQIWNLPCDPAAPTGREWVRLFAAEMHRTGKMHVVPAWGMRMLGVFVPVLNELFEMRYQYDREYVFDSSKFTRRFGYIPTSNGEAVRQTVDALRRRTSIGQ